MKRSFLAALALAGSLALAATPSRAEDVPSYLPQKGDEVVVYTHKFKAENYKEGMKLVEEAFPMAQAKAGQTRRNYVLTDPANYEVVLVSFFAPGSKVDEWHAFMGRADVLKQLQPMWSEPQRVERFILESVSNVPGK